ncbi:AsmA family protein [Thiomicrorhabdus sp.]|uniref:AsmA family protein n=1 Tax=Thiomicrorhabdus sp. TaxID=2039724 RepID=UPI0029C5FDF8|nr:AsmA family protein [Thiomicrorhabdus sp.]
MILVILPIVAFLSFSAAVSWMDFNRYKPDIEAEVKQITGRDLKISGSIDVSILPLRLNIGQAALRNPPGFKEENLLSVKQARIEFSLVDWLLSRNIHVLSLELVAPKLNLIRSEEGNNWQDLPWLSRLLQGGVGRSLAVFYPARESASLQYAVARSSGSVQEPIDHLQGLSFDSLMVRNGRFRVFDERHGFEAKIDKIDLLSFDARIGQPFDITMSFNYSNSLSPRSLDFRINSRLQINNRFYEWQFEDWDGMFKIHLPEDYRVPDVRLTTSGKYLFLDTLNQSLAGKEVSVKALESDLNMDFAGQWGALTDLRGTLNAKNLKFSQWSEQLGVPLEMRKEIDKDKVINGDFAWQWDGNKLEVSRLPKSEPSDVLENKVPDPVS